MENRKERETRLVDGKIAAIRKIEPILNDPEGLTEDIMNAIREISQENNFDKTEKSGRLPVIIILRRLLAAASVCLFLLFGYEEYVVVNKISRLEKQNAAISQSSRYQSALNLKKAMSIFLSDPEMVNRYKELKTKKIDLRTLLKATMYVDAAGINQEGTGWLKSSNYNSTILPFISILKQFDSTHYNIQR